MAHGAMCPPWEVWEAQGNEISYRCLVLLCCGPVHDQQESAAQTRVKEQSWGGVKSTISVAVRGRNQPLLLTDRIHLPQTKV